MARCKIIEVSADVAISQGKLPLKARTSATCHEEHAEFGFVVHRRWGRVYSCIEPLHQGQNYLPVSHMQQCCRSSARENENGIEKRFIKVAFGDGSRQICGKPGELRPN